MKNDDFTYVLPLTHLSILEDILMEPNKVVVRLEHTFCILCLISVDPARLTVHALLAHSAELVDGRDCVASPSSSCRAFLIHRCCLMITRNCLSDTQALFQRLCALAHAQCFIWPLSATLANSRARRVAGFCSAQILSTLSGLHEPHTLLQAVATLPTELQRRIGQAAFPSVFTQLCTVLWSVELLSSSLGVKIGREPSEREIGIKLLQRDLTRLDVFKPFEPTFCGVFGRTYLTGFTSVTRRSDLTEVEKTRSADAYAHLSFDDVACTDLSIGSHRSLKTSLWYRKILIPPDGILEAHFKVNV